MRYLKGLRDAILSGRFNSLALALVAGALVFAFPGAAFAASSDPFQTATSGAHQVATDLAQLALVVGGIGIISCLLLGFFGKMNWKWVATGIGASFAIAIVFPAINWLNGTLGGGAGTGF